MEQQNNIVIYQTENGKNKIDVQLQNETIWLSQKDMAELFECSTDNISLHLKNIYKEQELSKDSTTEDFSVVQKGGARNVKRPKTFYNLDAVIAVGYRINSKKATQFRIWATNVLKQYLVNGYVLNEKRLSKKQEQIDTLKNSLNLLIRSIALQANTLDDAQNLAKILENFAQGLELLDDYDNKTLATKGLTKHEAVKIYKEEYLQLIANMKPEFGSDVFANPKDDSFDSSINQMYQTFGGVELYPTLEEKASMLLYFLVKNHGFTDGNKRIGAACFLYFLDKNGILYKNSSPIIDNATLFTLTLLIAESKPEEKETMKQVILSVLNNG